jgi:hypothetical protein
MSDFSSTAGKIFVVLLFVLALYSRLAHGFQFTRPTGPVGLRGADPSQQSQLDSEIANKYCLDLGLKNLGEK